MSAASSTPGPRYVVVPGIDGSDDDHWQSIWQTHWGTDAVRIAPASWNHPVLDDWIRAIDDAARSANSPSVIVVAHSLGCLATTRWATATTGSVAGLFLVAPPDTGGPSFPARAAPTFIGTPLRRLPVPALVISSDDDPYCSPNAARQLAEQWDAGHVTVGRHGHLNNASNLGRWPLGRSLLAAFAAGTRRHL